MFIGTRFSNLVAWTSLRESESESKTQQREGDGVFVCVSRVCVYYCRTYNKAVQVTNTAFVLLCFITFLVTSPEGSETGFGLVRYIVQ